MASPATLTHIAVVGGTGAQWAQRAEARWWKVWVGEFAKVADHAGVRWLSIHPLSPLEGGAAFAADVARIAHVGGCTVTIDARGDGRQRLADAVAAVRGELSETSITTALNAPAPCDPDLMLIAAAPDVLPASMVWELAYSELVYVDVPWEELTGEHLEQAIDTFAVRHRRFGGL